MKSSLQSLISSLCLDLCLLLLITAGFFWRLLLTPGVYMPAGGGDLANFLYPTYRFVAVPAGRHQIRLVYDPPLFRLGLVLAGLVVPGLGGFWLARSRLVVKTG